MLESIRWFNDHQKTLEFIQQGRLDKFEEICRCHNTRLKNKGYVLTAGKACNYWNNRSSKEYHINSKGKKDGEYMCRDSNGVLIKHMLYENGVMVKDL